MLAGLDADQHRQPDADAVGIDHRDPAGDDSPRFQLLDALPARRRRQADAFGHLRDRQGRVVLQDLQEKAVDVVHGFLSMRFAATASLGPALPPRNAGILPAGRLEAGGPSQTTVSARSISAIRSASASRPADSRTSESPMPSAARSS